MFVSKCYDHTLYSLTISDYTDWSGPACEQQDRPRSTQAVVARQSDLVSAVQEFVSCVLQALACNASAAQLHSAYLDYSQSYLVSDLECNDTEAADVLDTQRKPIQLC